MFRPTPLALAVATALTAPYLAAETQLAEVKVIAQAERPEAASEKTAAYKVKKSKSATRLDLDLKETPQAVSVVTRAQMDDFQQNDINAVFDAAAGVNVERVETDRVYFTARGFDITNFQYDGVGMPFVFGNQYGKVDTIAYDRIEIIRGASGLLSPTGNPSATVNFARKRPTDEFQAQGKVTFGSWQNRRVEADLSGAANESGSVRARVAGAQDQGNSYLDRKSHHNTAFSAIVEADLTERTLLTLGHTQQRNKSKGGMWGALPMLNSDGTQTDYDVSTSTATDWAFWNNQSDRSFAEIAQRFGNGWQLTGTLTYVKDRSDSELFYAYGTPDATTGLGLYSYPSQYNSVNEQFIGDIQASGPFKLLGREHKLSVGVQASKANLNDVSHYGQGIGTPLPSLENWDGSYAKPSFDASTAGSSFTDRIESAFVSAQLNLTDRFKVIPGLRATRMRSAGLAYGVDHERDDSDVTPYLGATYALTSNWTAYASYAEIFTPQYETAFDGSRLAPVTGDNVETGLKGELFDQRLLVSGALFKTRQQNLAASGGYRADGTAYHITEDTDSHGLELEAAGLIAKGWQMSASYTQLSLKTPSGAAARTFIPRKSAKLATTWKLPFAEQVKIGANVRWQDDIYRVVAGTGTIRQDAYALLGLMASYDVSKNVSAQLNVNNVGNKKYINSLYWDQAYYGAPRNGSLSVSWKY